MSTINVSAASVLNLPTFAPFWIPGFSPRPAPGVLYGYNATFHVGASSSLALATAGSPVNNRLLSVVASTAIAFPTAALPASVRERVVSASSTIAFAAPFGVPGPATRIVSASSTLGLTTAASTTAAVTRIVSASSTLGFATAGSIARNQILAVSATTIAAFATTGLNTGVRSVSASTVLALATSGLNAPFHLVSASSSLAFSAVGLAPKVVIVSASSSLGLTPTPHVAGTHEQSATTNLVLSTSATKTVAFHLGVGSLVFLDVAAAHVILPSGIDVSGGDAGTGPQVLLAGGISGSFPLSFAETPSGLVLCANGVDPMIRWDGVSGLADSAGVLPPSTAPALAGSGIGTLIGTRYAYVRYIDTHGNPSALSPISNVVNLGRDAVLDDVQVSAAGLVTIKSIDHGLATGEIVAFSGVGGLPFVAGTIAVSVLDADTFTLSGLIGFPGTWTGGGSWTWGVQQVVYGNVPIPAETKVVRRQILRNLDGSLDTFYVDIDTTDLTTTSFYSLRDDNDLAAQEAVPIFGEDGLPFAARYAVPPSHKCALASHQGRIFAAGDVDVTSGCVRPVFSSATISGIGTAWTPSLVGRFLYVPGATQAYEITAIDPVGQTATLLGGYRDATVPYSTYAIRPAPAERKLVYYSEPGLPEAWPPWNAVEFPQDSDDIVGILVKGSYLYVLERRHIYRYTMQRDPARDGFEFLSVERGAVNNRCWAKVEDQVYLLDEVGIYSFDGGQTATHISAPIANLFQGDPGPDGLSIDWGADQTLWHAAHDPPWNTIRWFVAMVGDPGLIHAICYDYRQDRWWVECYPSPVTSSVVATLDKRRSLAGSDSRRVFCLGSPAYLDGADPDDGTTSGQVTSATPTTITDSNAVFAGNLAGIPVSIVLGLGRGQQRIVASNTSTQLEVVLPWDTTPDATSTYQVGGIEWSWRSGWLEYQDDEQSNSRDVALVSKPLINPGTATAQLFFDHSDVASSSSYSTSQDGVSTADGTPWIDFSLQSRASRPGWAIYRQAGHADPYAYGPLYVSLELGGVQTAEPVRIYQVTLAGVLDVESGNAN